MSPLGMYGSQVTVIGASGLMLIFFGMVFLLGASSSEGDARVRFLLFLFAIAYFPAAIYLRRRAIKHVGGE